MTLVHAYPGVNRSGDVPPLRRPPARWRQGGWKMLWTIAVVLIVLWLLGLMTAYTLGGFIHVLLVIAIIVVAIRLIQGRRVL